MNTALRNRGKILFSGGRVVTFVVVAAVALFAVPGGTARGAEIQVTNNSSTKITLDATPYPGVTTGCTLKRLNVLASQAGNLSFPFCSISSITLSNILSSTRGHMSCTLTSDMIPVTPTSENHYDAPARSAFHWSNLQDDRTLTLSVVCADKR